MTRSEKADNAARGIFKVLETGRRIDRSFIVRRFTEAGFSPRLAERHADTMIRANTDIRHWSRWQTFGTIPGSESYAMTDAALKIAQEIPWS